MMPYKKVLIKRTIFQGYKRFSSVVFYDIGSTNPKIIFCLMHGAKSQIMKIKLYNLRLGEKNEGKYYLKLMQ